MEAQVLVREQTLVGGSEDTSAISLKQDSESETSFVNDYGRLCLPYTGEPKPVGVTVGPQVWSLAGLVLGIATNIGKHLMGLDIKLSGPPLSQRERIGLEIRVAEKYWRYWISK